MRAPLFAGDRDPSRVHWMELFFDLIFVALVGQLAHGLHAHPSFAALGIFVALFASVWWSWVNLTFTVNVSPDLTRRGLSAVMLTAMLAVGALAVAAPEAVGDRAWLFAAGNAGLRLLLLGMWVRVAWGNGVASRVRILAYNGATALLWLVSIALPHPIDYAVWAFAVVLEIVLMTSTARLWSGSAFSRLNVEHLAERFGLLVIIVLGESVLSIVTATSEAWTVAAGVTAVLGLVVTAGLAWSFFLYGVEAMEVGLERLLAAGDVRGIRDTVGFLPFLLVAGVTAISGALASAIAHPGDTLAPASAASLGGGIALFYLTNAFIARRFGDPWRAVLRWAVPAVVLPVLLVFAGLGLPGGVCVGCAAAVVVLVVAAAEAGARRRARAALA
ncbi:low temperature requirement protein A [Leifsonia sp. NPDC058194]|uniref:low temperature requirement protein A n=1 Tax=Leifsonia sp. NPDC058194 TaxID=3346374 RepID=UPI0036D9A59A